MVGRRGANNLERRDALMSPPRPGRSARFSSGELQDRHWRESFARWQAFFALLWTCVKRRPDCLILPGVVFGTDEEVRSGEGCDCRGAGFVGAVLFAAEYAATLRKKAGMGFSPWVRVQILTTNYEITSNPSQDHQPRKGASLHAAGALQSRGQIRVRCAILRSWKSAREVEANQKCRPSGSAAWGTR
jgi:hypothetical protein